MFIPGSVRQQATPYTPGVFSIPSDSLFKYDASDISTLYQDTGGTTPVTTDLDPVGRWTPIEAQGTNRVQTLTGTGTYFSSTPYGPGVQPSVFREQVTGGGGGAVPPGVEDVRFAYLVVSDVAITSSITMLVGYGLNNTNRSFRFGVSASNWYLYKHSFAGLGAQTLNVARTQEQSILMGWFTGTEFGFSVNGGTPVTVAETEMDTVTSINNVAYGWHMSHTLTSGGFSAPSASQLITVHETAIYDYMPAQPEIDTLYEFLNSKWNGIGNIA